MWGGGGGGGGDVMANEIVGLGDLKFNFVFLVILSELYNHQSPVKLY